MSEEAKAVVEEGVDLGDATAVKAAVTGISAEDDLFNDDSTKPESNWFSFDKVGDSIQGVLVMEPFEAETKYGAQMVYVLQKADGTEMNVGLKKFDKKGNLRRNVQQLKSAAVGDILAFRFESEVDTGMDNMAKNIEVRIRHMMK